MNVLLSILLAVLFLYGGIRYGWFGWLAFHAGWLLWRIINWNGPRK